MPARFEAYHDGKCWCTKELMEQLKEREEDAKHGRVQPYKEARKELGL